MEPIFEKGVDQQSTDEARILLVCCTISASFWKFGSALYISLVLTQTVFLCRDAFWMLLLGNLVLSSGPYHRLFGITLKLHEMSELPRNNCLSVASLV